MAAKSVLECMFFLFLLIDFWVVGEQRGSKAVVAEVKKVWERWGGQRGMLMFREEAEHGWVI